MRSTPLLSLLLASVAIAQDATQANLPKSVQPKPFPALEQRLGGTWLAQWSLATNKAAYVGFFRSIAATPQSLVERSR